MFVSKEYYILNFLLVSAIFSLFVLLISFFGYFFLYVLKKIDKKDWELNILEIFSVSFAIGLSIYISLSFILDIFHFFNFYSAYLTIIVLDIVFIFYLIYTEKIKKQDFYNLFRLLKNDPKKTYLSLIILFIIIFLQVWIQWEIITKEYAIPSKDTYVWLGQSWYLLEKGYILRAHMPLHYPKGYTFFLAGPELIYPDWRLAYFYLKFGGIPFYTLYILIIFILLKKIFDKNYMIFIGLLLTLISNLLFSRFISFVSSSIPTLLILISLIILKSKCPFYIVGFFIPSIFLFNAIFGLFYILVIGVLLLNKLILEKEDRKKILINEVGITIFLIIILLLPYLFHIVITQNVSLIELFFAYLEEFGYPEAKLSKEFFLSKPDVFLLQFRYILRDFLPKNDFISTFLDIERRILSTYLIISIIGFFIPSKYYSEQKNRYIIDFGKISLLIIISFYLLEIIFQGSSNVFLQNLSWFNSRAVEALAGPLIIFTCIVINMVIDKSKILTILLRDRMIFYKNLLKKDFFSRFMKIENFIITIILISLFSNLITDQRIIYSYYFERDQIDAIFYVKSNIPSNSKLLVSDFKDTTNAFYDLLSTYDYTLWDFSFEENSFNDTINYIKRKDIEYVMLDYTLINSTEKNYYTNCSSFEKLFKNDYYIIFEIEN